MYISKDFLTQHLFHITLMMKAFFFLLCVAYANCFYIDNDSKTVKEKIKGGHYTDIEDIPYQANLMWNTYTVENICGATIIDKDWIVTAAHCVETEYVLEETTVRTGSSHITDGGNMYDIQDCFIHPDYNFMSLDNDIALIKLKNSIEFNKRQQPIAIAKPDDIPKINDWMIISGFGKTDDYEDSSEFLKVTKVKVVNYEACNAAYHRAPLTENMFCAGNYEDDACEGDSGGPGVINNKLYGVVSSGEKCGSNIYPGVYTKVYKYYDWIVNTTGLNL